MTLTATNTEKPVFKNYKMDGYHFCHPWNLLKMNEPIKIMRQRHDNEFTAPLNRIRTASQSQHDI